MIKWIKKRIDDFVWWVTDDMNIFYVILVLVVLLWIGTAIYVLATGGTIKAPKTQPIIYLPLMR
jgi:hypothetical protein